MAKNEPPKPPPHEHTVGGSGKNCGTTRGRTTVSDRLIRNTDIPKRQPWPEDVMVQGGARGAVFRREGESYSTAFVEAFPPGTFLRGEGKTISDAETACWGKYLLHLACDGGGRHGPYEARGYENGVGYCVKCGSWFSGVCEPSQRVKDSNEACRIVKAAWGDSVVSTRKWSGLVDDEAARVKAAREGESMPEPTTEDPTPEELRKADEPLAFGDIGSLLRNLGIQAKKEEAP